MDEVRDALSQAGDLPTVQAVVRTAARRLAAADGATFVLRDADHCFYADEDAMSPLWKGQRFPITECISGWAMRHARSTVIPDIMVDDRVPIEAYRPTFVRSLAMIPIGTEVPIGAIGVYWAGHHAATAAELASVEELAQATMEAIVRIGLFGPARPDPAAGAAGPSPRTPTEDRERIARDLHDTVLQRMFGSGLSLKALAASVDDAAVAADLREAIGAIDETIREMRGAIFGIEYGHDRLGGTYGDVLAVVAEASRALGFRPDVEFSGDLDALDQRQRQEVPKVLSELLSNVGRHARAGSATVEVAVGSELVVRVTDNGVGPGDRGLRGNGLGNLEARAAAMGGDFHLYPGPQGGTVAEWVVPR